MGDLHKHLDRFSGSLNSIKSRTLVFLSVMMNGYLYLIVPLNVSKHATEPGAIPGLSFHQLITIAVILYSTDLS